MKIHPTASVHPKAELANDVVIGHYSIVEENVKIESGTEIGSHCLITGHTSIGEKCRFFTGAVIGSPPQDLKYKGKVSFLEIGKGNTIREYVTINPATKEGGKTRIGDNNLLMAYSHVAHDCHLGSSIVIANAATLAGFVTIEDGAILGGLVGVHQFTRIGTLALIGGCSKVVQDVLPYSLCDGHPAATRGLNIIGLRRAGFGTKARSKLKSAFKLLTKAKISTLHAIKEIEKEIDVSPEITHLINFIKSSKRGICS